MNKLHCAGLTLVIIVVLAATFTWAQQAPTTKPASPKSQECINTDFYVDGVRSAVQAEVNAQLIYELATLEVKNAEHVKAEADVALTNASGIWTSKDVFKEAEDRAKAANEQLKQANDLFKRSSENWKRSIDSLGARNDALDRQLKRVEQSAHDTTAR